MQSFIRATSVSTFASLCAKPYLKTARHRLTADIKYLYLERFPRNDRAQRLLASNRNEMTVRAISMTPFKIYPQLMEGYSAIISRKPCSTIDIEQDCED